MGSNITKGQKESIVRIWRYAGYLLGVPESILFTNEAEARRLYEVGHMCEPRDVRGTALLIHGRVAGPDDQWLYLPALKRVKRISSSNQSGSFMGNEFDYEDLTAQAVEKFTYRYLRDEPCGEGLTCTVTERFPVDRKSGYSRQIVWRDKNELRVWKVAYYDRKNAHLKTLTLENYVQYLDQYWRAASMTMVNHLTGKSTTLTWSDFQFRTDIDDRDFTRTGLRRVR